ncbi:MAG TPA: hypothetical protein VGI65_02445 [Steroidobacteraceae bacterium]
MTIAIDDYVFETLMRDLSEHERSSAAFLVYLYIWAKTMAHETPRRVPMSYQALADATGLSKTGVQNAVRLLKRRRLLTSLNKSKTATPEYRVERPWKRRGN